MSEASGSDGHYVSGERFRERTTSLFRLCEAWLAGSVTDAEFLDRSRDGQGQAWSLQGGGASLDSALRLSREFEHAIGCSIYVEKAIAEMRSEGLGDRATSAVRALYFAKSVEVTEHVLALNACIAQPDF